MLCIQKEWLLTRTRDINKSFGWFPPGWPPILKEVFIMASAVDSTREFMNELVFTPEELKELERAKTITFDEDRPETTPERAMKFRRVNQVRRMADRCTLFTDRCK